MLLACEEKAEEKKSFAGTAVVLLSNYFHISFLCTFLFCVGDICSPTGNSKNPKNFLHFQRYEIDNCHTPTAVAVTKLRPSVQVFLRQTKKSIWSNHRKENCHANTFVAVA